VTGIDWGVGEYERTAAELWPAAEHVAALADVRAGAAVLDLGCGTGNAALAAARAGADVTGLDPARRLLDVARATFAEEGLQGEFVRGTAAALPFGDSAFDIVLSLFGVIFEPDGERAVAEILRVLRPGGRGWVSAWRPEGGIHEAIGELTRRMGAPSPPAAGRIEWGEPTKAVPALERLGAEVGVHEATLAFTQPSAEAWIEEGERHHPMSMTMRRAVTDEARYEQARAAAIAALERHNEDPAAFRVTSRYVVYELRPARSG
jgi:SAM-dependent methyltransferase